jgi:hypothetical protein
MLRGKRSCRVWRKHWTCWEGMEVVEFDKSIEHVRQTLQLLFPLNMFNALVKLYNFSSLSTYSMLSLNSTTSLPSQQSLTKTLDMLRGKRSCRVWRKHWTCWEGREVVEFDESIEHVEREEKLCFRQTLQLLFPLNMSNAFVKLYNFSSLSTCSMLSSNSTTSLPSQHVQCFRQTLQLWTCWEGREVVEFDENIGHVEREEKL